MTDCWIFRRNLERWLAGRTRSERFAPFAPLANTEPFTWGDHLAICESCRSLLEGEQALEALLDTLPAPQLPPELTLRLLDRLQAERRDAVAPEPAAGGDQLDRLLDCAAAPAAVPAGLAAGVLAGLAGQRTPTASPEDSAGDLDALLDRVPSADVPIGLERRVLVALAAERERVSTVPWWQRRWRWPAAAIAGLLLGAVWRLGQRADPAVPAEGPSVAGEFDVAAVSRDEGVDPRMQELLLNLELLENWDLVVGEDLDLLLSSVDEFDEALFDVSFDEDVDVEDERDGAAVESPSKG